MADLSHNDARKMQNGTPHNRPKKPIKPNVGSGTIATDQFNASFGHCPLLAH